YESVGEELGNQPAVATANTVNVTPSTVVPLETALTATTPGFVVQNTYGVDPGYRLGHVQIWNLDVQHDLSRTVTMGIGYTGTKGSDLDVLRAPNRGATGLIDPTLPSFIWESPGASSTLQSVSFRLRKRLTQGIAASGTYTLSKSIDNASSIGGARGDAPPPQTPLP